MEKSLFYFAFFSCLVASSKQQQSRERKLEAFRLAQSVETQVLITRELSVKLESLLNNARSELDNITISKGLKESTLNATLQPYADVILYALRTAISVNNSAAKDCVEKARASIAQATTSAVNKDVLDCQTKIRIKLSNFVLKLVSLYNALESTISNALSDCPYSFSIESASDLEKARVCYTTANNTIKAYIIQTTKDLDESQVTFNALQDYSCLSLGVEVAVKQGQAVVASMVACGKKAGVTLKQQSRELQLEAFTLIQSVEKQVVIARELSVEPLLNKAKAELDNTAVSKGLDESTLNATLQPYSDVILDALRTANLANNNAAKDCVVKALASIAQPITTAVNTEVLDCQNKTRARLSNVVLKLTSLYNAQGTTISNALYNCPNSSSIESTSDLEEARVCYTTANNTIKAYISQTSEDLEESQVTFNALQGNSCLSLGVEVAVKQAQAVVASMVACGKAAGVGLAEPNLSKALREGYADLEEYVADARKFIRPFYEKVKDTIDKVDAMYSNIASELLITLQDTRNLIDFVQAFLKNSTNQRELNCVRQAKVNYDDKFNNEGIYAFRYHISQSKTGFSAANLNVTDKNLQTFLDKAVAEAAARCTSNLPLTAESVTKCFDDEFYKLQDNVWGILKGADVVVKNAEKVYSYAQEHFEFHAILSIESGYSIVTRLASCLKNEKIEFIFDQQSPKFY